MSNIFPNKNKKKLVKSDENTVKSSPPSMNIARYLGTMCRPDQSGLRPASVKSEAKIEVWPQIRTVRLEGELGVLVFALTKTDIGPLIKSCLEGDKPIVIDASEISLVPSEVQAWVAFVEGELADRTLRYKASQLSEILRYHEGYEHSRSTFEDYGDETPLEINHFEFAVLSRKELSSTLTAQRKAIKNGAATESDTVIINLSRPTSVCALA
jgi:hypothetical protein